jgi:predicted Zn-dependent protease
MRWIATPLLVVLALVLGCATNPVTGHKQLSLVSSSQELQMGSEGYKAVVTEYGVYESPGLKSFTDSIGQAVARVSHQPNLEWHFTLLDDPVVNAFAMPGGYIYVTRGILAHLGSEAQLAGVLGHECGHVTARHTAARLTQQQLAGLGLGVASVFSATLRQYGSLAQQGLGMLFLKYSRDDENQADQLGVDYSTKAGYDSREIPKTYTMLGRIGARSGSRLPTFLSTHPDPGDREVRTTALAQQATAGKTGLLIRERSYIQRLDGMVFGNDPRNGYFEGSRFYHPQLAFQIAFPEGWNTQNARAAVSAAEPGQHAMMQFTIVPSEGLSPSGYVGELQRGGKITGARGTDETINGSPAWLGHLAVQKEDGTEVVLTAAFIRKSDAQLYEVLGQSAAPGDAFDEKILESARSLRTLTDPSKLSVKPDRVRIVTVKKTGTFAEVVGAIKPQALSLEDTSILNNIEPDETVRAGELIKIVEPGR